MSLAEIVSVSVCRERAEDKDLVEDVTHESPLGPNLRFVEHDNNGQFLHVFNARAFESAFRSWEAKLGGSCYLGISYSFESKLYEVRLSKPHEMSLPFRPDLYRDLCEQREQVNEHGNSPDCWTEQCLLESWFKAAKRGSVSMLKTLWAILRSKVPVDVKEEQSFQTALMFACQYGHQPACKFLLDQGAELNKVTNNALDNAFMFSMVRDSPENTDLTRWLLSQKDADITWRNYEGGTLLHHAVFWGNLDVVKLLVMEGLDIEQVDLNGDNAVQALGVSLDLAHSWMSPECQWDRARALACAAWLRTEGPQLVQDRHKLRESHTTDGDAQALHRPSDGKNVMISYQWESQPQMVVVKQELEARGFQVWLDLDRMSGSILASMAEGIESSDVVLMAVSTKYQESDNCRLEAEYACRKKKKIIPLMMERFEPSSWLGLILGAKLYIDCTSTSIQQQIPKLEAQLDKQLNVSLSTARKAIGVLKRKVADRQESQQSDKPLSLGEDVVAQWTCEQVTAFVNKQGLHSLAELLAARHIEGRALLELKHLCLTHPSIFHNLAADRLHASVDLALNLGHLLRTSVFL